MSFTLIDNYADVNGHQVSVHHVQEDVGVTEALMAHRVEISGKDRYWSTTIDIKMDADEAIEMAIGILNYFATRGAQ